MYKYNKELVFQYGPQCEFILFLPYGRYWERPGNQNVKAGTVNHRSDIHVCTIRKTINYNFFIYRYMGHNVNILLDIFGQSGSLGGPSIIGVAHLASQPSSHLYQST